MNGSGGLTIGVDNISSGESTAPDAPGGMRAYLTRLLLHLPLVAPTATFKVFTPDWNADFGPLPASVELIRLAGVPRTRGHRLLYQYARLPVAIAAAHVDVLFAPATVAPARVQVPVVLAVQFLQHYDFPESFGILRTAYLKWAVPSSVRRSTRVITFTEFQRRELLRHVRCDPSRIAVVPHGVDERVAEPAGAEAIADVRTMARGRPFIAYVSATYRYKNHLGLLAAFAVLKRTTDLPHVLLLVGTHEAISAGELRAEAERLGLGADVFVCGRLPSVAAVYQAAEISVFPSLYETFGLPLLESMLAGCPVVASDRGAMAELGGDAVALADPAKPEAFARTVADVLKDASRRADLAARGRARAAAFTWTRTARLTYAALEEASRVGPPSPR